MASNGNFIVKEAQPESLRLKALKTFSCPSVDAADGDEAPSDHPRAIRVKSTLILGESPPGTWWSGVGQVLGWQGARAEDGKAKYRVVLAQSQEDQSSETETPLCCFELHQGCDLSESTTVFQSIRNLLEPLLQPGTILMTRSLLSMLILPTPKELTDVPSVLLNEEGLNLKEFLCCKFDGKSLLHLACEKGDVGTMSALLDRGADLLLGNDKNGNTVLHTSCKLQSSECLALVLDHAHKALPSSDKQSFIDGRNHDGLTALQVACQHDYPDAVQALVNAGASVTIPVPAVAPSKTSSANPFHLAAAHDHHECISAIVQRDKYLSLPEIGSKDHAKLKEKQDAMNAVDSNGDTPLIIAVTKGHVNSTLALLLEGADSNRPNSSTSDYPLSIASRESNITMVRLLLVFDANPSSKNSTGQTPLDEAKGSSKETHEKEECISALTAFIEGQGEAQCADAAVPTDSKLKPDENAVFLLTFDGGGIRGLVMAQMLIVLQQRMNKLHPNPPHVSTLFDWIAGTSTGAYLSLGLSLYKTQPEVCRKMYFEFKKKALSGHRVYSTKHIEDCLKAAFGEKPVMADVKAPRVCVTTCLADRLPPELHLMCNFGEARDSQKSPTERKIWEACTASSAAPTYFPAFEKKFLDGGVMANNPTLDTLTEIFSDAKTQKRDVRIGCILSLGTGVVPTTHIKGGAVNIVGPHGPLDLLHDIEAFKDLVELFIMQSTISEGQETARARAWCECMGTPYFRFSPPIENIDMNETDNERLIKMLFDTVLYTFERGEEFDRLASLLLARGAK